MFIDVISDMHIDHWKNSPIDFVTMKNKDSTVLAIAGDVGHSEQGIYNILNHVRYLYEHIVIIDGNHEHYFSDQYVTKFTKKVEKNITKTYDNITFLNGKNQVQIGDTVIVGVNGWYDWALMEPQYGFNFCQDAWNRMMNDSRYIMFDDDNYNDGPVVIAKKQAKQLKKLIKGFQDDKSVNKIVVMTHTAPFKELLIIKNEVDWDSLSASFGNSLMAKVVNEDKNKKIKNWIFGHTHQRQDVQIGHIRYTNNARGYPFEDREMGAWTIKQIEVE